MSPRDRADLVWDEHPGLPGPSGTSMSENSLARFASGLVRLALALVAGVITARALGPAGKGALSTLLFMSEVLLSLIASLGLEEASLVLIGQRRATEQRAISASFFPLMLGGVLAVGALFLLSYPADWEAIRGAVVIAGVSAGVWTFLRLATSVLNAQERIVTSSGALALGGLVTAVATYVLLVPFHIGFTGAALAALLGPLAALGVATFALRRQGIRFRPGWDLGYLKAALPLGLTMQVSQLVVVLAMRLDLLLVYGLSSESEAGWYSVALTASQTVGGIGAALSMSTFPRIAGLDRDEARRLTVQTGRLALVGGALVGAVLLVAVPLLTVPVFGRDFAPVVPIALGLLPSSLLWGAHWVLARAEAARGRPGLLLATFALNVVIMAGLDVMLIPIWGTGGAVVATLVASAIGLSATVWWLSRGQADVSPRDFIPRLADLAMTVVLIRRLITGLYQRLPHRGA